MSDKNYLQMPILMADGRVGLVIRQWDGRIGAQVPGEENIRWRRLKEIVDYGDSLAEFRKPAEGDPTDG